MHAHVTQLRRCYLERYMVPFSCFSQLTEGVNRSMLVWRMCKVFSLLNCTDCLEQVPCGTHVPFTPRLILSMHHLVPPPPKSAAQYLNSCCCYQRDALARRGSQGCERALDSVNANQTCHALAAHDVASQPLCSTPQGSGPAHVYGVHHRTNCTPRCPQQHYFPSRLRPP